MRSIQSNIVALLILVEDDDLVLETSIVVWFYVRYRCVQQDLHV